MDKLFKQNIFIEYNGFQEVFNSFPVKTKYVSLRLTPELIINENELKNKLLHKLMTELSDCVNFVKRPKYDQMCDEYMAYIRVIDKATEYVNIKDNQFIVENNKFSNEELIHAVKNTFPERFI